MYTVVFLTPFRARGDAVTDVENAEEVTADSVSDVSVLFAKRFKLARLRLGLKPTSTATRLGITRQTIGNWERGNVMPGNHRRSGIAAMLGVSPEWLFEGVRPSENETEVPEWALREPVQSVPESEELREIFAGRLRAARVMRGVTQSGLGKALRVTRQAVNRWEEGKHLPTANHFARIGELLGVEEQWLRGETDHWPEEDKLGLVPADVITTKTLPTHLARQLFPSEEKMLRLGGGINLKMVRGDVKLLQDDVDVPFIREVALSIGAGKSQRHAMLVPHDKIRFPVERLRRGKVSPEHAAVAIHRGNSMERVILDGSLVAVDLSQTEIIDGRVYAFEMAGRLHIRYLYQPPQGVRIISENDDEHPPQEFTLTDLETNGFRVIGEVWWWETFMPR